MAQTTMTYDFTQFVARDKMMDRLVREVVCTGPASYVTGGDDLDPDDQLGLSEIYGVYGTLRSGDDIRLVWWNYATQRLMIFVPNTDAEVANGVDLSGFTGVLLITGKG